MTHTLMICDQEELYAEKLAQYINSKPNYLFEARFCSNVSDLRTYLDSNEIDMLLVSSDFYELALQNVPIERIIVLYGNEGKINNDSIYKYQKCENIMRFVLKQASVIPELGGLITRKSPMSIIGFYSPIKRSYQTSLAIVMGQLYGRKGKTLYVSLESYSSISKTLNIEFECDLADVMYELGNGRGDIAAIVESSVKSFGSINILPPMDSCKDLKSITYSEWNNFFCNLERGTDYEFVILDISDSIQPLFELMTICKTIYLTEASDEIAKYKYHCFANDIKREGGEELEAKIVRCMVPKLDLCDNRLLRSTDGALWKYAKSVQDGERNE